MNKNMYIKNICGTESDIDDLWVYQTPTLTEEEESILSSAHLALSDATLHIFNEIYAPPMDYKYASFCDLINDPTILVNNFSIDTTDRLLSILTNITDLLEQVASTNTDISSSIILFYKLINEIKIICCVYKNQQFYFE